MLHNQIKRSKLLITTIASALIVAIIVLLALLNSAYITLRVSPTNAVVTVDNRPISINNSGYTKVKLTPGDVVLKIEADGYIGYSQKVALSAARNQTVNINLQKNPTPITIGDSSEASNNVQFISEADEQNALFYLGNNGSTLYKAKFDISGEEIITGYNRQISNPPLSGIRDIIWSPQKDAAIFKKDNGSYSFFDFQKYNFVSQAEAKYGDNIGDLAWSPDNSKIAYYYAPPSGEKSLIFADKTNTNMTRMLNFSDLGIENPYLAWSPDSEFLIIIPRNSDSATNKIYLYNAYTRALSTINDDGGNLGAKFTPDGNRIIYSTIGSDAGNPVKQMLNIMDKDGNNKKSLELHALISKIAFLTHSASDIVVATYNPDSKSESLFVYNIDSNAKAGFTMNFDAKTYIKELSVARDDKMIFYIANSRFYALALKN